VSVFALGDGLPAYVVEVRTGHWPRHIAWSDGHLYVANQLSHDVMIMQVDAGDGVPALEQTINTPSPTCILPSVN
jgi:6-phosphogluconolactonase (cycloisomerase 2 family)